MDNAGVAIHAYLVVGCRRLRATVHRDRPSERWRCGVDSVHLHPPRRRRGKRARVGVEAHRRLGPRVGDSRRSRQRREAVREQRRRGGNARGRRRRHRAMPRGARVAIAERATRAEAAARNVGRVAVRGAR